MSAEAAATEFALGLTMLDRYIDSLQQLRSGLGEIPPGLPAAEFANRITEVTEPIARQAVDGYTTITIQLTRALGESFGDDVEGFLSFGRDALRRAVAIRAEHP